jgi:hypothetical protein
MSSKRHGLWLLTAVGLVTLCGASCPRGFSPCNPQLPPRLPPAPSVTQVIDAVNRNNGPIQSFSTSQASLSSPGMGPTLRANVAFERQKRLRLRADFMSMPELDLGSNDDGFWFWVKRNQPPAVYWCRHDQFAASAARQMIPVEPEWVIESLGIGVFDPSLPHQGPYQLPNNRLEIRTVRETPQGPCLKVTIVDASQAWILEQRLHDAQGRMLAASATSRHRQDPATGLWMPQQVQINCPLAQFSLKLDLGPVQINRLQGDPAQLWSVPNYPGAPLVDLADPRFRPGAVAAQ